MHGQVEALLHLVPMLQGKQVSVAPLSGGITNHNYCLEVEGARYVLRVGGENTTELGIDRDREYACSQAAAALGVGPGVVAYVPDHALLVTWFVDGTVLSPEDTRQPETLRRVTATLRRYHDGPPGMGSFSPFDTVREYHARARSRDVPFPSEMTDALRFLGAIETAVRSDDLLCPCHNDLLPANFIDDGSAIRIIDWEYAGMGDRFFDLGNLAVNHHFGEEHEQMLLSCYFGEVRHDHLRRLRLMRLASDMREALWGYLQSGISSLHFDFLGYGRQHLQRFLDGYASSASLLGLAVGT